MPLGLPRDCCVGGKITLSAIVYKLIVLSTLVPAILMKYTKALWDMPEQVRIQNKELQAFFP